MLQMNPFDERHVVICCWEECFTIDKQIRIAAKRSAHLAPAHKRRHFTLSGAVHQACSTQTTSARNCGSPNSRVLRSRY